MLMKPTYNREFLDLTVDEIQKWQKIFVSCLVLCNQRVLYGLLAFAIVLISKLTNILNFAHVELAMVSTFFTYSLMNDGILSGRISRKGVAEKETRFYFGKQIIT